MQFINDLFDVIFNDPVISIPAGLGLGALVMFAACEAIIKVSGQLDAKPENE